MGKCTVFEHRTRTAQTLTCIDGTKPSETTTKTTTVRSGERNSSSGHMGDANACRRDKQNIIRVEGW